MQLKMFDGAMGTMLQQAGVADKPCPEYACITNPEVVASIHRAYIEAGADIIETNTFGANPLKLQEYGLEAQTEEINLQAVKIAKAEAAGKAQVAGSIGSVGQLIHPLGEIDFDVVVEAYARQIKALAAAGVDYILLETIIDIQEMRAGLLAAKSVCDLPVICQMTFEEDGRTVTGTDIVTMAKILEPLGASVLGVNCSLGPAQLLPLIEQLGQHTSLPISVQANAGMPKLVEGKTVFPLSPTEMAAYVERLVQAGANYIGGCCGTTPEHIRQMKLALTTCTAPTREIKSTSMCLASRSKFVNIGQQESVVLIGERINPTGRKLMAAEIKQGDFSMVKREALNQVAAGAGVLDVNMGVPGIDQKLVMREVVTQLAMLVDVPLAIDSTDPEVIEAGLRYYPGRALINSVSDNEQLKGKIFALAKKYGAAVILLPLTENQLPQTAAERIEIIERLVREAKQAGLSERDLMLDALVLTVATDAQAAQAVLETLQLYKQKFGYPTTMGLSNISFGLPKRECLNLAFYNLAVLQGLTSPIINPLLPQITEATAALAVLLGKDQQGLEYSQMVANAQEQPVVKTEVVTAENILQVLTQAIMTGEKERAVQLTKQAIEQGQPLLKIANESLSLGMQLIGEKFSTGKAFLPQVLLSAESMRAAFNVLQANLKQEDLPSQGTVLLATVQGDIHDLGKNIVAALLSNNGFKVLDLGKDVSPEEVIACVEREKPDIVGLCALMTTTLPAMQATIKALRRISFSGAVMVGGAVVTEEYANSIEAQMYAADAIKAVELAKGYCGSKK